MKDAGYNGAEDDPASFVAYLIDRLSVIPGSAWVSEPAPWHTSYEDWHVVGTLTVPGVDTKEDVSRRSFSGTNTKYSNDLKIHKEDVTYPVAARVSKYTLRLERQYQLNKTVLDEFDPSGKRHIRALQLVKLRPRNDHEVPLTAIIMEYEKANTLRNHANYGPNWYLSIHLPTILEWDPSQTSSRKYLSPNMPLHEFLDFAIEACACFEVFHQGNRFVHGELRTDAFFYCDQTRTVKLLNYGSGIRAFEHGLTSAVWTSLSREFGIEHKLQFIAPEQTGRSQAAPDSRTDLYSLGIVFYSLLTGTLPFGGQGLMEIVQNVLSRPIPSISTKRSDIPEVLSVMIRKMASKNIEDRYHSATGVKWDLQRIQQLLNDGDSESLVDFKIASHDVNSNFVLPSGLFGREKERASILRVIERVSQRLTVPSPGQHPVISRTSSSTSSHLDPNIPMDDARSDRLVNLARTPTSSGRDRFEELAQPENEGLVDGSSQHSADYDESAIDDISGPRLHDASRADADSVTHDHHRTSVSVASTTESHPLMYKTTSRKLTKRGGRTEVVGIEGAPGLGKSTLIQSIQPAARSHGYFCSGVFSQLKTTPYESILRLLSSLFRQIFSELDLSTPFHVALRDFIRPIWGLLYPMLGLPEWLCDSPSLLTSRGMTSSTNPSHHSQRTSSPQGSRRSSSSIVRANSTSESAQNNLKGPRFTAIFLSTLRFLSSHKVLVFSWDDIQFADDESLDLLLSIVQAKVPMVLLFTFRSQDELSTKASAILMDDAAMLTQINLPRLNEEQITSFIAQALNRPPEYCFPLVAVVSEKTDGNPFFMRQLLSECFRKGCIWFSWSESQWLYDLDRIFDEFASPAYGSQMNNDFILARLLELPSATRELLAWANLLGSPFKFSTVKALLLKSTSGANGTNGHHPTSPITDVKSDLVRRTSQDIVRALSIAISSFIVQPGEDDDTFRFSHDRYQQAVAALPESKLRDEMQYQIVSVMIYDHEDEDVFDLASHVCACEQLLRNRVHKRSPYRAILRTAAEKAMNTGGRASALKYYSTAMNLLQEKDPWDGTQDDCDYEETLSLFTRTAECYFYEGHVEIALTLLETIFSRAQNSSDRMFAYILKSRSFIRKGDPTAAFGVLKHCLRELGFETETLTWEQCDQRFLALYERLRGRSAEEFLSRPLIKTASILAATKILLELMAIAFFGDALMYYQFTLLEMEINLGTGVTGEAGMAFVHMGTVAVCRFDMVEFGVQMGQISRGFFAMPYCTPFINARGIALHCMLLGYLETHVGSLLTDLDEAMDIALTTGDPYSALFVVAMTAATRLWASQDLVEVENYCIWGPEDIRNWERDDARCGPIVISVRQLSRALQGKTNCTSASTVLGDQDHETEVYLKHICERSPMPERARYIYMSFKLQALHLFGYHAEALVVGQETTKLMDAFWSLRFMVSNQFYMSLSGLALLREGVLQEETAADMIKTVTERQARMEKWACVNDVNFAVWASILSAQLSELTQEYDKSITAYETALDHADVHNFAFDEALTFELYGEFLIRRGTKRPATAMLRDALARYRSISAFGKANHLAGKHEWLLLGTSSLSKVDAACQTYATESTGVAGDSLPSEYPALDRAVSTAQDALRDQGKDGMTAIEDLGLDVIEVTSILQSSQILNSELNIERLMSKMTKIILESTGAEATSIVVHDEERGMVIPAVRDSSGQEWLTEEELEEYHEKNGVVAKTIITNCIRFKETLLIPNILEDDRFSNVPENYPFKAGRAMCAFPLTHGTDEVFGAIFMEGPPHSFTERNVTVLRLLVNPISVSITNAMLFKRVEQISSSHAVMVESQKHSLAQAREAQQKAKLAEARAVEAVRAKSMFLANVSHELRTPLNGVIGMSELLKDSKLNAEQIGYADSIRVCADTLLTVINDILDFSKLEAGQMQMFSVPLSLTETIAEVVRALSYSNTMKPLKTIMELELDESMLVMGDPVRLHQILMNLLSNSYKFTPQGAVTVRAIVNEETDREIEVTCSVSDTGIGISPEQKQKLFKPFSQADSSTARTYGGTGLGLSICKAIIENVMKGSIWLDSEIGKGTAVSFKLRFAKIPRTSTSHSQDGSRASQNNNPMAVFSPGVESTATEFPLQTNSDANQVERGRIRICIAEDNPINQKIAISFVKKLGYTCEAYGDGRQAVDALAAASAAGNAFHIVLMDVQMPVLDGYDASREIRKHDDTKVRDVIIIAMTASAIRGDREKCLEAGMNNYLAKPVRQQMLKQMLDGYVAQGITGLEDEGVDVDEQGSA